MSNCLSWSQRGSRGLKALLALLLVFVAPAPASADQAAEAQLQFELGTELYKQGRFVEAIDRFVASNRLAPNPNVVLNVAQTFAYLKRSPEAYNWYSTYLAANLSDEKRAQGEAARNALAAEVAIIDVATQPPGAELFVDRLELGSVGRSPRKIAVEPGMHRVFARQAGWHDASSEIRAERGQTAALQLALELTVGRLEVRTQPAGAHVRLEPGARDLGVTPLSTSLPVGESRLVVTAQGYVEQTRTVLIREEQPSVLELKLGREASTVSVLSVTGNVPGARVFLDQVDVGAAPLSVPDLPPGTHTVSISAKGREPWTGKVLFEPGTATRVQYQLIDPSTRSWKGWRFVGYGVGGALLGAGGVTGLFALKANSDFDREPSRSGLDSLNRLNTVADVLGVAGLVVAGGTLVWDVLTPTKHSQGRATLSR